MVISIRMTLAVIFLFLLIDPNFAQSKFNNQIQPGRSTRADVTQFFGQPTLAVTKTLYEYKPPSGFDSLFIEYRSDAGVVERVEAAYKKPQPRATVIDTLGIKAVPNAK